MIKKDARKKIFSFFLALTVLFGTIFSSPPKSSAFICDIYGFVAPVITAIPIIGDIFEGPWYDQNPCQFMNKVFTSPEEEIFGERYTYAQVNWILNSFIGHIPFINFFFKPTILSTFGSFFLSDTGPTFDHFASFGPAGSLMGIASLVYSAPMASSTEYLKYLGDKFNIIPSAEAQGYGFSSSTALMGFWEATRNLSYLIMVLLLLVTGFLIIFKIKVSAQAAVTIQVMIPKIITTLILVTFSYAIAGFVIDMIYVILSIFIYAVFGNNVITSIVLVNGFANSAMMANFFILVTISIGALTIILFPFGGPLIGLILMIITIFLIFKITWLLVKTYISLIFKIMFGPLQIMLGLLPVSVAGGKGGGSGFSGWLKGLIADASVFVVIPIMLIFTLYFWHPLVLLQTLPFIGAVASGILTAIDAVVTALGLDTGLLGGFDSMDGSLPSLPGVNPFGSNLMLLVLMGYGTLSLAPKAADMIRDAINVSGFKYGSAFGEPLSDVQSAYSKFQSRQADRAKATGQQQFLDQGLLNEGQRAVANVQTNAAANNAQPMGE